MFKDLKRLGIHVKYEFKSIEDNQGYILDLQCYLDSKTLIRNALFPIKDERVVPIASKLRCYISLLDGDTLTLLQEQKCAAKAESYGFSEPRYYTASSPELLNIIKEVHILVLNELKSWV